MPKILAQQTGLLSEMCKKSCRLHILQDDYIAAKHCLSQDVKQGKMAEINSEVCENKVLLEMLKYVLKNSFSILKRTVIIRQE